MMRHQIKRAGKLKPKKPIAWLLTNFDLWMTRQARLAQSVERKALNLVVVGSSPTVGVLHHQGPDQKFGRRSVLCRFPMDTAWAGIGRAHTRLHL